jgi:hypothetical protein
MTGFYLTTNRHPPQTDITRPLHQGKVHVGMVETKVARFFLVKHTQTDENIPNDHKIYQIAVKYI